MLGVVQYFVCAYFGGVNGVPSVGVLLIATVTTRNLNAQFVLIVSVRRT